MNRRFTSVTDADIDAAASEWIVRRDAGLSANERIEFETWREADPRHAEALNWHDQIWATFDRPRRAGQSGVLMEKFTASATRRRRRRQMTAVTAAFALGLVAMVSWPARSPHAAASAIARNAIVVQPDRQTLADGSIVELRRGAKITVAFDAATRRVLLLAGEAHFHVAKGQPRPFIVVANGVEVHAIGTAFSVGLAPAQVDVLVTEGLVNVVAPALPLAPDASTAPVTHSTPLGARQRMSVPFVAGRAAVGFAAQAVTDEEMTERLAWRSTRLEFTDTPLAEAVALMNRHAGAKLRIVVDDERLAQSPVTGLFRADNTETFVQLLEASLSLKAERSGDTITLRPVR